VSEREQPGPSPADPLAKLRAAAASAQRVTKAARPQPINPNQPSKTEPPFDVTSWSGALIGMLILDAVLWVVQFVNAADSYRLDRFGLRPRDVNGLEGIVTAPFLHTGYGQLLTNSVPFVLIGWVVLLSGIRPFLLSSGLIIAVGGLATWLMAPSGVIVGASGLTMGWMGYLLARAYFSRKLRWIVVAVLVAFFFTGLLGGLLPSAGAHASWQVRLFGFLAGVLAAWVMHPRRPRRAAKAAPAL
jgi:membrane associated rhomboid family serine protease